jgi:MFS-type transporter involved in bile tolerance (Atg22 family)
VIVSAVKIPNTFIFLVLYFFLHNGLSAITYLAISIATSELAFSPLIFMIGLIIDPLFKLLGNFIFYFIKRWLRIRSKHLLFTLILAFLVVCGYGILGMTELPFGLK